MRPRARAPGRPPNRIARAGFTRARVRPRGRKLRFEFARRVSGRATVDVFQAAVGRRVLRKNQRVAHFTGRRGSFTWNGRGRGVRNGHLFARFRVRVIRRRVRRPPGHAETAWRRYRVGRGVLPAAQLRAGDGVQARGRPCRRPAPAGRPAVAFRVASPSRVSVEVLRGKAGGAAHRRRIARPRPQAPAADPRQGLGARVYRVLLDRPPRWPGPCARRWPRRASEPGTRTLTQLCQGSLEWVVEWTP